MQGMTRGLLTLIIGLLATTVQAQDDELTKDLLAIQQEWAHIHYQLPEDQQGAAFIRLEQASNILIARYPSNAEPLVWKAIILATHADVKGGLGALSMVRDARELLERAKLIDPNTLDGSVFTTLGSLYYQVPGWPLGYGDDTKAERLLKKALTINPRNIDANYFSGDFLYRKGYYLQALDALEKGLHAPDRPNRPIADEGRRKDIQAVIEKIKDRT